MCIKRRSVIPNRASCLLATRLETISKVIFIICSKALSFIHSVIRLSHIFGSFKTSFVSQLSLVRVWLFVHVFADYFNSLIPWLTMLNKKQEEELLSFCDGFYQEIKKLKLQSYNYTITVKVSTIYQFNQERNLSIETVMHRDFTKLMQFTLSDRNGIG